MHYPFVAELKERKLWISSLWA